MKQSSAFSLTNEIVEQVAEHENVDPVELPPLYDTVDVESLEALFENSHSDIRVQFSYIGYDVTVSDSDSDSIEVSQSGSQTSR
ncbi:hypothetical protein HTZ84_09605 [Haloterrigena sp. SYSU A558-1]|uniref:Halobacterial output domain-containing protein n=1 Tax=Haloterrigena gelatinilytica TaxID=2741724 RepID=A0ABX2LFE1_9EURY|nr:HalOD1 output domain-containing protein [Haloterrigena gelatinilytica]NUC72561.1 hypothetical protein [Haloterrigena gelatinilytica]